MKNSLKNIFGNIDIYLFDQLLKGTFDHCEKILDAGCGYGKNLPYFLQNGFQTYGIDSDMQAIESVIEMAQYLNSNLNRENFKVAQVEQLPFKDAMFDVVISSAVLHFAKNKHHFEEMLLSMWRVLKPDGFLFVRLASNIGIENKIIEIDSGRYLLPDGSERYLVSEQEIINYTNKLHGVLWEPIKTTNVKNLRCMTTWCLQKSKNTFNY